MCGRKKCKAHRKQPIRKTPAPERRLMASTIPITARMDLTIPLILWHHGLRRIMAEKIDSHHHLWQYDKENYGWIDENMGILRRDFLPPDLDEGLRSTGIDGAVGAQAPGPLSETSRLFSHAARLMFKPPVLPWA